MQLTEPPSHHYLLDFELESLFLQRKLLIYVLPHLSLITGRYFDEISQDTGKYCFGVEDTLKALEMGAVEILIAYENLDIMRYVLYCQATEEEKILYLTPEQEKDKSHFTKRQDKNTS